MHTELIEDELIMACKRMGYGIDINYLQGTISVNTGSNQRKDRHVFKSATLALMWVDSREQSLRAVVNSVSYTKACKGTA